MNEKAGNADSRRSREVEESHSVATSLFGGAILATVATASLAQATYHYFDNSGSLSNSTVSSGYVVLGGMQALGDGGGGTFMPGTTTCSGDLGIKVSDTLKNCFHRADPTYSVREWGALCDVVNVDAAGMASWTNGPAASANGTLTVPTNLLPAQLVVTTTTTPPVFIAISQIGSPTLWGSSSPAVSMTRFSRSNSVVVGSSNMARRGQGPSRSGSMRRLHARRVAGYGRACPIRRPRCRPPALCCVNTTI